MKTKRVKWIVISVIIIILAPVLFVLAVGFPWLILAVSSNFLPEPSAPQSEYGEFPFTLVYEKDGERIEVIDTLVVEYLGVGYNEGMGKYNQWDTYYKSEKIDSSYSTSDDDLILIDHEFFEDIGSLSLTFELGSPEYYMGLEESDSYYKMFDISPGDMVVSCRDYTRSISNKEIYDRFNIKIIEKTISSPLALYTEETQERQ